MNDRAFVRSLLAAVDYPLDKFVRSLYLDSAGTERRNAMNGIVKQPNAWESLMRALSMTLLNLGSLADPPHIVEVRVTNRWSRWKITADGPKWNVEQKQATKGRPRKDALVDQRIRDEYKRVHPETQLLHKELRQCYKNLDRSKKRRPRTRRSAGEAYLTNCAPPWLPGLVGPSTDDEEAVLVWADQTHSKIDWIDFLAGQFAPRDLALSYLGWQASLSPSTIANILKPRKKTVRK